MAALSATYVDADTFTVSGDLTTTFVVGRRVKCDCGVDGYKFGTITSRSFGAGVTTVNLTAASDNLTSNLTGVWYGIVGGGASDQSIPIHSHDGSEGSGGEVPSLVKQVVRQNITSVVSTTTVISESSTPTSTSGVAFGSGLAITLTDAGHKVRVQFTVGSDADNDSADSVVLIHRGTTVLAVAGLTAKKEGLRQITFDFWEDRKSVV